MKTYLVGGAVRDKLLGLPVKERDYVVVGTTPEQMLALGFKPVGKDFPVFLHPQTKAEYALARTERKSGRGYHGFIFYTGPEVRLEDDLIRRDLSINAMAEDEQGKLVDPHGGRSDLEQKILRHVSPAFAEDPVRVLRVARFYARFKPLGFRVADETLALLRELVASGEVDQLVSERVWQETCRALMEADPAAFFELLRECGATAKLFPELDALFGVPQPPQHHPEIDSGIHTLLALNYSAKILAPLAVRYAVLCHDFGKGLTPKHLLPKHHGHEHNGVPLVEQCSARLRVPTDCRELAVLACRYHLHVHIARELRPDTLLELLESLDAFRRPERFEQFLQACESDARGRTGLEQRDYPQAPYLRGALAAAQGVAVDEIVKSGLKSAAVGSALREQRIRVLTDWRGKAPKPAA
ncbi:MAG: multifunctional CCA addition/repair protein [Nevskiales bacterium]